MSDKELLELAAKAAGLHIIHWNEEGPRIQSEGCKTGYFWTPLTDDGDALRLAVKLGIGLTTDTTFVDTVAADYVCGDVGMVTEEPSGNDSCAATRLAIVRSAAEIGKAQKHAQSDHFPTQSENSENA